MKIPEGAVIEYYQNISLRSGISFPIFPFLKELLLSQAKIHDYKNVKILKENG